MVGLADKKTMGIDVAGSVASEGRRIGLFGECGFTGRKADVPEVEDFQKSADHVKGFDVKNYAVFSRSGFTESLELRAEAESVALFTLDDLYDPDLISRVRSEIVKP